MTAAANVDHSHPNRHRKALRSAIIMATVGVVLWVVGVLSIIWYANAYVVALVVAGITTLLLSPVWYFTYMEILEPELYQHDS